MASRARLLWLACVIRLRVVGWFPWLCLLLWLVAAAVGEPRVLRSFGIHLPAQAMWVGFAILLVVLLTAARVPRGGSQVFANWILVVLLSGAQAGVGLLFESKLAGDVAMGPLAARAGLFALSMFPLATGLAVAYGCNRTQDRMQTIVNKALALSCIVASTAVGVRVWQVPLDRSLVLAAMLPAGACLLTMACSRRVAMITNRP